MQTRRRPPKQTVVRSRRIVREILVAQQRAAQLELYRIFRKAGHTAVTAARLCRASVPSLWRWQRQAEAKGLIGLIPSTSKCGRKPKHESRNRAAKSQHSK